jgi:hypothetical protein
MNSFENFSALVQAALIVASLVFCGIALSDALIRRRNKRAIHVARAARRAEAATPFGLSAFESAGPEAIGWAVRREIMPVLAADACSVSVNGQCFADPAALVAKLRELKYAATQESHALAPLKTLIETSAGQIELWLGRDSSNAREYWVFHPGLESTRSNAIGHIFTDLLDAW